MANSKISAPESPVAILSARPAQAWRRSPSCSISPRIVPFIPALRVHTFNCISFYDSTGRFLYQRRQFAFTIGVAPARSFYLKSDRRRSPSITSPGRHLHSARDSPNKQKTMSTPYNNPPRGFYFKFLKYASSNGPNSQAHPVKSFRLLFRNGPCSFLRPAPTNPDSTMTNEMLILFSSFQKFFLHNPSNKLRISLIRKETRWGRRGGVRA